MGYCAALAPQHDPGCGDSTQGCFLCYLCSSSKHEVKAIWFMLEQVSTARSSPARSRQLVLGTGRAYLTRWDAVDDRGVRVPPQPARAHDVLGEKEKTAVR